VAVEVGPAEAGVQRGPAKAGVQRGPAKAGHYVLHYDVLHYVLAALVLAVAVSAAAQSAGSVGTVWQGVYTEAQAERGLSEYVTHCARCHRDDLSGYNNILQGRRFMEKYRESSLHLLFDKTRTTMPRGAPGSLSDNAYVDIVSYLLKVNEFPAGTRELSVDDLGKIQLVGKDGPAQVPDFALVRVVGCLTADASNAAWTLTHSSDPIRTGNPQPAPGEREATQEWPLGPRTYSLMVSAAYGPGPLKGHKVEVRGFLIRRPAETRLNITSLETLNPACGE
jgi:mono/diheme cytochrome c family protein